MVRIAPALFTERGYRALGGDSQELSSKFSLGQPVLVPGDMGTASWVLAGPVKGVMMHSHHHAMVLDVGFPGRPLEDL